MYVIRTSAAYILDIFFECLFYHIYTSFVRLLDIRLYHFERLKRLKFFMTLFHISINYYCSLAYPESIASQLSMKSSKKVTSSLGDTWMVCEPSKDL